MKSEMHMERHPRQEWLATTALRLVAGSLLFGGIVSGCDDNDYADGEAQEVEKSSAALRATLGPAGGELIGEAGSPFAGVKLVVPEGALAEETEISITRVADTDEGLPKAALPCGPMFAIEPEGLTLTEPAAVTLPFDEDLVEETLRFPDEVKVWVGTDQGWDREIQIDSTASSVTVELGELNKVAAGINPPNPEDIVAFAFTPVAAFESCMAQYPNDPERRPYVEALVVPGERNDAMFIYGRNIKPGLGFDLFSLERSLLGADGAPDPEFDGFGLAWYQTDLEANRWGRLGTVIRTVLLDEAFGLDSDVGLAPTRTFHAGFWFTNPEDAVECGFDPTRPTPFNGEQNAGPLAMTTVPDAETGLGPLCTDPETCLE